MARRARKLWSGASGAVMSVMALAVGFGIQSLPAHGTAMVAR